VQSVDEDEDDLNKTEILVSEPKKMGDGMNAYIVYKVTTRVRISHLSLQKASFIMANLISLLFSAYHSKSHMSVATLMLFTARRYDSIVFAVAQRLSVIHPSVTSQSSTKTDECRIT